jgi:hypothetical protein
VKSALVSFGFTAASSKTSSSMTRSPAVVTPLFLSAVSAAL